MRKQLLISIFLIHVSITLIHGQDLPQFKDGDRLCFIGNSITHGGTYHTFLQLFLATRFPDVKLEFFNAGIAGDVVDGMINRLDQDVFSHQPDYAFIMTGMNDIQRSLYFEGKPNADNLAKRQKALDNYYIKTEKLTNMLMDNKVQPIFMTPSIYDQTVKIDRENNFGSNDALGVCAVHIRKMAKKYNAPLVDFYTLMNKINSREQSLDSTFTIVGGDRIHPGDAGHLVMAYEVIKSIIPSESVANMELNGRKQKVQTMGNCTIEVEKVKGENLIFKVLEKALPFPLKPGQRESLNLIPFQEELNKEMLTISKLAEGSYKLLIDDQEIGTFTHSQLGEGVNLSDYPSTPQYKHAERVLELCYAYKKIQNEIRSIYFVEYRMLNKYNGPNTMEAKRAYLDAELEKQVGKSYHSWNVKTVNNYFEALPKELEFRQELIRLRDEIYTSNQPEWHTFKLNKML